MKVVLVDDERIALDHMRTLIPWEEIGYEIAAAATNGRSALRLCEEHRPQIMIVDIRMPVMDGLELIHAVAERDWGVKFIVMSAYEDFNYARQAIALGCVSSYLVKHEVDRDKLVRELAKAKLAWQLDERQRKFARSEQLKEAFLRGAHREPVGRPPLCVLLAQADAPFEPIPTGSALRDPERTNGWMEAFEQMEEPADWKRIGQFSHGAGRLVALFEQRVRGDALRRDTFRSFASSLQRTLQGRPNHTVSFYYAFESDDAANLPEAMRKLEYAARHAVFAGRGALVCANDLPLPDGTSAAGGNARNRWLDESAFCLKRDDHGGFVTAVAKWFDGLAQPVWDLTGLYEAVGALTALYRERLAAAGLPEADPLDPRTADSPYDAGDIRDRLIRAFGELRERGTAAFNRLSPKLLQALRYLHAHYQNDVGIEEVAEAAGISVRYMHELFKRELGRTFLDYLTEYRVNQAKLILMREDAKMADVSARVGYRSPQHFSQVFKRLTGVLPHQFRAAERAR
ncbi:helix-turn-helix domain-containing protein [Paenibacillus methanolicus]|uniref:Two-component system response regulator YesN n=1 Tax=Paenibacillus methanolicus TaxID=582686 RepID=A0A5S5CF95_9BACL|nr:helix-turn-helix domain-containing protein [Paenibacillus methanolicus]TYP76673.1 two-component system response regulator YesN [Paenibacillus methanolicus]